jgi:predicted unusual protein kinase regulating ubiquinone biosynthesis (AarF/ABC1/UbiB family)
LIFFLKNETKKRTELTLSDMHKEASVILKEAFRKNAGLYIKFGQLVASVI